VQCHRQASRRLVVFTRVLCRRCPRFCQREARLPPPRRGPSPAASTCPGRATRSQDRAQCRLSARCPPKQRMLHAARKLAAPLDVYSAHFLARVSRRPTKPHLYRLLCSGARSSNLAQDSRVPDTNHCHYATNQFLIQWLIESSS
jgi:hypothetical protein